jgi:Rrf2 family nitric oxide-sensitive transcriptional repressor
MQLTKHTDYAFRVLIFLSKRPPEKLSTISEITEYFDISRNHVMKIVQKLANEGIIKSVRGKRGGIKLGKAAKDIDLRTIIELMEVTLKPVDCETQPCRLNPGCKLKKILFKGQEQYMEYVGQYTVADLTKLSRSELILFK